MDTIEKAVATILTEVGENVKRPGLVETPSRVARAYRELLSGLKENPDDHLKIFPERDCDTIVVSEKIELISMCEHHLLPFTGYIHIGYLPRLENGISYVLGLSKLARIARVFSKRPQVQERLTNEIANYLMNSALQPQGVGVIIKARHLCAHLRGVKEPESVMTTSVLLGKFRDHSVRSEFFNLLKLPSP